MKFNTTKCKVMHVGKSNQRFQYMTDDQILESTVQEKDLGVIVTDSLKVAGSCHAAYTKANRVLSMMRRKISLKTPEVLLPLYRSLVRPRAEYCVLAWSPHYNKDKVMLEKIQHRFTRMVHGLKQKDYATRLDILNLRTLEERRNRADLIEMFKMFKGRSGIAGDVLFERVSDTRTRGHSLKLKKQYCSKDLRKFFFSERVISRWNALDEETVSVTTVNSFKNKMQRIRLLQMSFYTDPWCPTSSKASS